MDFKATSANPLKLKTDCVIVLTDGRFSSDNLRTDEALFKEIQPLMKAIKFDGKNGSIQKVHTPTMAFKQIILVGVDGATAVQERLGYIAAAANQAIKTNSKKVLWIEMFEPEDAAWQSSVVARSIVQSSYK